MRPRWFGYTWAGAGDEPGAPGAHGGDKDKAPLLPMVLGATSLVSDCKHKESLGHRSAAWYFVNARKASSA